MDEHFVSGQQPQGIIKEIEKKVATEDKQDDIIAKEYKVFRNAAGNGRRMMLDSDRHG